MAANEGHDGSTVLEPDSYKLQSLHGPKASAELPIISTYNESDVKVFVKVTDSDVRTIMVNIESDTVAEMKQKVTIRQLFQTELTQGMRIRLIYKGKIMLDGHKLAIFKLQDQAVLHAFVSEALERSEGNSGIITNQVRGLDKLVEQGFNHDEIRALRFHFHAMCILKYEEYNPKTEEIRFAIEEKWISGQLVDFNLTTEEACQLEMTQLTGEGSSMDLVWGLCYGLVLSLGMILVLRLWPVNAMQRKGAWSGMVLSGLMYIWLVVWIVLGPNWPL